jgi:hypothetical protein
MSAGTMTRTRVDGLTDDEHWWSPVEDAWTARVGDCRFSVDSANPEPEPAPFTSLSWRMYHLMGCYAMDRNAGWLGPEPAANPMWDKDAQPIDAVAAIALLARCQDLSLDYLDATTEETPRRPLGDKAGPYGASTGADYVPHQIDEHIHHGAEIALLRDLHRARG